MGATDRSRVIAVRTVAPDPRAVQTSARASAIRALLGREPRAVFHFRHRVVRALVQTACADDENVDGKTEREISVFSLVSRGRVWSAGRRGPLTRLALRRSVVGAIAVVDGRRASALVRANRVHARGRRMARVIVRRALVDVYNNNHCILGSLLCT